MQFYLLLSEGCLSSTCWCVTIYIFILSNPFLSSLTCIARGKQYMLCSGMFSCLLGEPSLESLRCRKWREMVEVGHREAGSGSERPDSHYRAGTSAIYAGQQSLVPGRTGFSVFISARKLTLANFLIFSQQSGYVTLSMFSCNFPHIRQWCCAHWSVESTLGQGSYPVWVQEWA